MILCDSQSEKYEHFGVPKSRIVRWEAHMGAPKRENFEHSGAYQIEDYTSVMRHAEGSEKWYF